MIDNRAATRLHRDILDALTRLGELDEALAVKVANLVLERLQERRYGNGHLYVPAKGAARPIVDLKAAYANGEPVRSICRRERISRSTLYRILRRAP